MTKIFVDPKHKFSEIVDWLVENMPNDDSHNRWKFNDEFHILSNENLSVLTKTYISFKDDKDAILFSLRWS